MLSSGTLFIVLLSIFIIWYILFHIKRGRLYELAAQFDGPRPLPIIGNVLKTIVPLTDITNHILGGCLYYKSPSRLWIGPHLSVHVWDPENVKIVLNSPHSLEKQPYIYKLVENVAGHGLITSPVNEWKRHRRLIAPVFNQKYLENFLDVFNKHSKRLVDRVEDKVDKGIFDGHDHLVKYAMDTVMDVILDYTDENDETTNTHNIAAWFHSILESYTTRMTNIWYFPDFIFNRSSPGRKLQQNKLKFDQYIDSVIKKLKEDSINKYAVRNDSTEQTGSYKPVKFMDHLLAITDGSGKFTAEELHGEINTIISAGLETVSSTIGFILILLGMYPEAQENAFQEIKSLLGNRKQLDCVGLRSLEYLDRVIKEGLRIFPGIVGIGRYNDQEIQLTDHIIPVHTSILIPIVSIHRDPNIWPNPTRFDPDRFLPEEDSKRHPYSWIPFAAGPRNCVGLKFAQISLKVALSTILLNYKITTDYKSVEDIPLTMMTVFKPINGYRISITRRN